MKSPNNRWRGPSCVVGLAPRALREIVRPRRHRALLCGPSTSPLAAMTGRSVLFGVCVILTLGATPVPTAKSQCEELLNVVLPFAEKMLAAHGEFYPFGASMTLDGQIVQVAAYDGREHPPSQ